MDRYIAFLTETALFLALEWEARERRVSVSRVIRARPYSAAFVGPIDVDFDLAPTIDPAAADCTADPRWFLDASY